eukprot:Lankesteria_metandrocarpae@DN6327_c0_g1_i1.p1
MGAATIEPEETTMVNQAVLVPNIPMSSVSLALGCRGGRYGPELKVIAHTAAHRLSDPQLSRASDWPMHIAESGDLNTGTHTGTHTGTLLCTICFFVEHTNSSIP